jgi:DNA helicase-2/ATP-dependent DNA helicase PcrA
VGDGAQPIDAFRGAEVQHILAFPQRCDPTARVLALTQSFRSTPQWLAVSNADIAPAAGGFGKVLWSTRAAGCLPRLVPVEGEAAQTLGVADA